MGTDALATVLGAHHPVRADPSLRRWWDSIPNCGASVAITELYSMAFSRLVPCWQACSRPAALVCSSSSVRTPTCDKNLLVTAFVYAVGVIVGLFATKSWYHFLIKSTMLERRGDACDAKTA